jgi:lysophospholipid acyltransferase (LPLAT)-like uncharacterized protein
MVTWIKLSLLPVVAAWGIRALGKTMSWTTVGWEKVDAFARTGTPIIIAFWHGRQLMMPLAYRGTSASILISQHRDGGFIANIMKQFGFSAIRGSTTRGGTQALRKLVAVGRQGQDLVVTPDGPRGPACQVQMGVMSLAKLTGFPIVPLTFACSKKKSFPVGITFKSLFPGPKGCLFGEIPSGWHLISRKTRWVNMDWNYNGS